MSFLFSFLLRLIVLLQSSSARNQGASSATLPPHFGDSGLQLDLEIALNDVSAKIQPLGLFQPCRRFRSNCRMTKSAELCHHSRQPFIRL